jgi:ATP-dependent 26S proteasome regulatory subunit
MTASPALTAFREEFTDFVRARYPLLHVVTWEEDRAVNEILEIARHLKHQVVAWSVGRGIFTAGENDKPAVTKLQTVDLAAAVAAFDKTARTSQGHLFLLLDPFRYFNENGADPIYTRRVREFAMAIRTQGYRASCIIVAPPAKVPIELEKEITQIDFPLPARDDVRQIVDRLLTRANDAGPLRAEDPAALGEAFVNAALGLTAVEIENALAKAVVDDFKLDLDDVENMFRQKQQIVRKTALLDYVDVRGLGMRDIGGLDLLKQWLDIRDGAFSQEGRAFGIATPKGVLITGISGCGKSLSAKCVAASWRLPLVKLDMGKIYSSLVGSSEEHIRQAIAACEAIAPCVLWIDEIEKGLPRARGFVGDSGVSLRVLGTFLTWLQEKTAPVFVFATANEIGMLPPEMLRKGRFDEIFFVDLPTDEERREIIRIHIARTGRDPLAYDLDRLTAQSGPEQFGTNLALTGAEIEAWVNESLIRAYDRRTHGDAGAELHMDDFKSVIDRFVPLAKLRADEIQNIRAWAEQHAVGASRKPAPAAGTRLVGGRALQIS